MCQCTRIICFEALPNPLPPEVTAYPQIRIVGDRWMENCLQSGSLVDDSPFLLYPNPLQDGNRHLGFVSTSTPRNRISEHQLYRRMEEWHCFIHRHSLSWTKAKPVQRFSSILYISSVIHRTSLFFFYLSLIWCISSSTSPLDKKCFFLHSLWRRWEVVCSHSILHWNRAWPLFFPLLKPSLMSLYAPI